MTAHADTGPRPPRLGAAGDGDAGEHPPARRGGARRSKRSTPSMTRSRCCARWTTSSPPTTRTRTSCGCGARSCRSVMPVRSSVRRSRSVSGRSATPWERSPRCSRRGPATSPSTRPVWSRAGRSTGRPRPSSDWPGRRRASTPAVTCASCPRPTFRSAVRAASPGGSASRTRGTGRRSRARCRSRSGAVATSGTAARGAHLFDPRSGQTIDRSGSVTVVGPDAALGRHLGDGALRRGMQARLTPSPARHPTTYPQRCEDAA